MQGGQACPLAYISVLKKGKFLVPFFSLRGGRPYKEDGGVRWELKK